MWPASASSVGLPTSLRQPRPSPPKLLPRGWGFRMAGQRYCAREWKRPVSGSLDCKTVEEAATARAQDVREGERREPMIVEHGAGGRGALVP